METRQLFIIVLFLLLSVLALLVTSFMTEAGDINTSSQILPTLTATSISN